MPNQRRYKLPNDRGFLVFELIDGFTPDDAQIKEFEHFAEGFVPGVNVSQTRSSAVFIRDTLWKRPNLGHNILRDVRYEPCRSRKVDQRYQEEASPTKQ